MIQELVEEVEALQVSTPRRSSRKRTHHEDGEAPRTPAPKRKSKPYMLTGESLKRFYMNKSSARFARQALETIYEDPQTVKSGPSPGIGSAKIKRSLNMERILGMVTKQKKVSRKNKIKRLGLKAVKFKKMTDEEFRKKLRSIEAFLTDNSNKTEDVALLTNNQPSSSHS